MIQDGGLIGGSCCLFAVFQAVSLGLAIALGKSIFLRGSPTLISFKRGTRSDVLEAGVWGEVTRPCCTRQEGSPLPLSENDQEEEERWSVNGKVAWEDGVSFLCSLPCTYQDRLPREGEGWDGTGLGSNSCLG